METEVFKINSTQVDEDKYNKFKKICYLMDLKGDTESKKHGYYKILTCGIYKISWDSWNNTYYVQVSGNNVEIIDYVDILYKEIFEKYKLPSQKFGNYEVNKLLDILYIRYPELKKIIDNNFN